MIRPLRRNHRVVFFALGVLLPAALATAITARRPLPVAVSVSAGLTGEGSELGNPVWTKADVWPGRHAFTRLTEYGDGTAAVDLMFHDLVKPDVLVYWSAGEGTELDRLPENARLLGVLADRKPLRLPADGRNNPGRLVLYSLAEQEIVAVSNPITF